MTEHRIGTQEQWQAAARRAAEGGEGADPPRRRAGQQAARAALGTGRAGLPLRDRAGHEDPRRSVRRPLPVARLPLHVRPGLRGRLPGLLLDRGHARSPGRHLKARDTTLLLASRAPLEKLLAYRERMGWGIDWVSSGGSDFNRDLGFLYTQEELKPFLEGEIPVTVEQNARMCGTDAGGLRLGGSGPERVRPLGRDRLPDLRNDRPRPRARDGLLRPAGPDAEGPRRGRLRTAVGAPPRRVRSRALRGPAFDHPVGL